MSPDIRRYLFFTLFALTTAGLWALLLFPSDAFRRVLENHLRYGDTAVRIGGVSPGIRLTEGPGLRLTDIRITKTGFPPVSLAEGWIRPKNLLDTGTGVTWVWEIRDPIGEINGEGTVSSGWFGPLESARLVGRHIRLDAIPVLRHTLNRPIQGILDAEAEGRFQKGSVSGILRITAAEVGVGVNIPDLALEMIQFQQIDARMEYAQDIVQVRECRFSGPHLTGQAAGEIHPAPRLEEFRIFLQGKTMVHHPLMAGFQHAPVLAKISERFPDGIPFQVSGSLARPRWSIGPPTLSPEGNRP